jgi:hypothetical protein
MRGELVLFLLSYLFQFSQCDPCKPLTITEDEAPFSSCEWVDGQTPLLIFTNGTTLKVVQVTVLRCGTTSLDGSVFDVNGFQDAIFEKCEFTRIVGGVGAVRLQSSTASEAWFTGCNLTYGNFVSAGFLSTGTSRGPFIHVDKCIFEHHSVSNGGGLVNGNSGHWYVENTSFTNCTNKPQGQQTSQNGALMKISPDQTDQEVIVWFHNCTLMNPSSGDWFNNPQLITVMIASGNGNTHFSFRDSYAEWLCPYQISGAWNTDGAPMYWLRNFAGVTLVNITHYLSVTGGNKEIQFFEFGASILQIENSYFERKGGSNGQTDVLRNYAEAVFIDTTMIGFFRVFDIRTQSVVHTWTFINCTFQTNDEWSLSRTEMTMLIIRCTWLDVLNSGYSMGLFNNQGSNSKVYLECCCLMVSSNRGDRMNDRYTSNQVMIGSGNCISLARDNLGHLVTVRGTNNVFGCPQTQCSTTCYGQCQNVRMIPALMNWTTEDCIWSDKEGSNELPINFKGDSLVVKRCQFIRCGWPEAEGGCIQALSFTGDLLFEEVVFTSCKGGRGSIHLYNSVKKVVIVLNCNFSDSQYQYAGCVSAAQGGSQLLTLEIIESRFVNCSVSQGTGVISSQHPGLHVENCLFEECIISYDDHSGSCIFLKSGVSDVNVTVTGCTLEGNNVGAGTVSSLWIEGAEGNPSLFAFRNSTFHWDSSSVSANSVIGAANIQRAIFEYLNVSFSSSCQTESQAICHMATVSDLSMTVCDISSSGNDAARRVALTAGTAVLLRECNMHDVHIGVRMEKAGDLSIFQCRFNEIRGNCLHSLNIPCNIVAEMTYFGETETYEAGAFIHIASETSTVTISFCCFQTENHAQKKAVTCSGEVVLRTENCFSHKDVGSAVEAGKVTPGDGCGTNHYNCHSDCRFVCPTTGFTETRTFSSTGQLSLTDSHSESESVTSSKEMPNTDLLPLSSPLPSSRQFSASNEMSSTLHFTETSLASESKTLSQSSKGAGFRMTNDFSSSHANLFPFTGGLEMTSWLTKSNAISNSDSLTLSKRISMTQEESSTRPFLDSSGLHDSTQVDSSSVLSGSDLASASAIFLETNQLSEAIPPILTDFPPESPRETPTVADPAQVLPSTIKPPSTIQPLSTIPPPSTIPVLSTVPPAQTLVLASTVPPVATIPLPATNTPAPTPLPEETRSVLLGQSPYATELPAATESAAATISPPSSEYPDPTMVRASTEAPVSTEPPPATRSPPSTDPPPPTEFFPSTVPLASSIPIATPSISIILPRESSIAKSSSVRSVGEERSVSETGKREKSDSSGTVGEMPLKKDESSDHISLLIVSVILMVIFCVVFAGLLYKENERRKREELQAQMERQKAKNSKDKPHVQ